MKKFKVGSIVFGILSVIIGFALIFQIASNKASNYIPMIFALIVTLSI